MNIYVRKERQNALTVPCDSEKPDLFSTEGRLQIYMDNLLCLSVLVLMLHT
jgi:hypothetical protein